MKMYQKSRKLANGPDISLYHHSYFTYFLLLFIYITP